MLDSKGKNEKLEKKYTQLDVTIRTRFTPWNYNKKLDETKQQQQESKWIEANVFPLALIAVLSCLLHQN